MKFILGATLGIWLGTLAFPASAVPMVTAGTNLESRELRLQYAEAAHPDSGDSVENTPSKAKEVKDANQTRSSAAKRTHHRRAVGERRIEHRSVTLGARLDGKLDETPEPKRPD